MNLRLLIAVGIASFSSGFLAAEDAPPLNSSPSGESLPGKFEWADLFASNATTEADFYTKLFDWTPSRVEKNGHVLVLMSAGSQPVASIVQRSAARAKRADATVARWVGYLAVADLATSLNDVSQNGGKVLAKARQVPGRGEQAIVAGPDGAVLGLIHSSSGDLPDFQPANGEIAWAELFTAKTKEASTFYQKVFRYEPVIDPIQPKQDHYLLATGEFARAGIAPSPPWEDDQPDWLVFFCVSDAQAAVNKVTSLGGSIVAAPHTSRHGGKIAIVTDPEGGMFGMLELETAKALKEAP